ncbi:hypothetical protein Tco_0205907 [Tanacetum coccineum]
MMENILCFLTPGKDIIGAAWYSGNNASLALLTHYLCDKLVFMTHFPVLDGPRSSSLTCPDDDSPDIYASYSDVFRFALFSPFRNEHHMRTSDSWAKRLEVTVNSMKFSVSVDMRLSESRRSNWTSKLSSITFSELHIFSISSDANVLVKPVSYIFSSFLALSTLLLKQGLTCMYLCKIISSALSTVDTGAGGVRRVDFLSGRRKQITVDHFGALDPAVSILGLGDLRALVFVMLFLGLRLSRGCCD